MFHMIGGSRPFNYHQPPQYHQRFYNQNYYAQGAPISHPGPPAVIDEDPVQSWCNDFRQRNQEDITVLTVQEMKKEIVRISTQLNHLSQYHHELSELSEKNTSISDNMVKDAHHLMTVIQNDLKRISTEEIVESIRKKVKKSFNKKNWRRRWRARNKIKKSQRLAAIAAHEKKATEWLKKRRTEQYRILQEERMKKQADEILHEVRSKQEDATKAIELLNALAKLRSIRKTAAENTGVYAVPTSESNKKFEQIHEDLEEMFAKQMDSYKEEEKVLQVIIGNETEAQKQREAVQALEKSSSNAGYLGIYQNFWLQAESSIETLIEIRRQWDSYIVPATTAGSSKLPTNDMVMPMPPSSDEWKVYLKK